MNIKTFMAVAVAALTVAACTATYTPTEPAADNASSVGDASAVPDESTAAPADDGKSEASPK